MKFFNFHKNLEGLYLKVAATTASINQEDLINTTKSLHPTILIIDEETHLTHSIQLLAYLRPYDDVRLVIVSANDNHIRIYYQQDMMLTQTADLINALSKN